MNPKKVYLLMEESCESGDYSNFVHGVFDSLSKARKALELQRAFTKEVLTGPMFYEDEGDTFYRVACGREFVFLKIEKYEIQ